MWSYAAMNNIYIVISKKISFEQKKSTRINNDKQKKKK